MAAASSDLWDNPLGTDGFEFVEYAAPDPDAMGRLFEQMGFTAVARHRAKNVLLYRQGSVNFIVNAEPNSFAQSFARVHGPSICAIAFRVRDAAVAYAECVRNGAWGVEAHPGPMELNIPAIAALLGAGVLLGPAGLEAVHDRASIDTISNLGLTLLLFVIGLEVNLSSLLASGRTLVVTGIVQVPLTLAAGLGVFLLVGMTGVTLASGVYSALYLGVACAFSSTLLVVKYLQEHLQLDTLSGRLAVGLLIFQDIWAIVSGAIVSSTTRTPMRAAASAASQPACPPPTTMTSQE